MIRSAAELRQPEHDEQERLYAEFLAKGKKPTILAPGVMVDTDPNYNRKAAAKKAGNAAPGVLPPTPVHRVPNAETFSSAPAYKGPKRGPGKATSAAMPRQGSRRRGEGATKLERTLGAVTCHPCSAELIAAHLGEQKNATLTRLWLLRERGLVKSQGNRRCMLWVRA